MVITFYNHGHHSFRSDRSLLFGLFPFWKRLNPWIIHHRRPPFLLSISMVYLKSVVVIDKLIEPGIIIIRSTCEG
nr:MAG TPA: hypothetical protein [Caudoviricetes sp.]